MKKTQIDTIILSRILNIMAKERKKSSHVLLIVLLLLLAGGLVTGFFMYKFSPAINVSTAKNDDETLKQMASDIAKGWNIPDLQFEVTIHNKVGDYALVFVTPTNQTLDPLQIVFKKENGKWMYVNMGTSFPDLEEQMPELFR